MTRAISTANLARASARRPWLTIGAWFVVLVVSVVLTAMLLGDALTTDSEFTGTPDSKAAELLIAERLETTNPTSDIVLVRSSTQTVDDPGFQQAIIALAIELGEFGKVSTFYESRDAALVSEDRDTTIINLFLSNDASPRPSLSRSWSMATPARCRFRTPLQTCRRRWPTTAASAPASRSSTRPVT